MNNVLIHHGIKGMKWGVRRYQNKDGSLTTEGKQRLLRQKLKDSLDGNLPSDRASKKLSEKYDADVRELDKIKPADSEWFDKDGKYTSKAKKYMESYGKLYETYRDKDNSLWKKAHEERDRICKKVFGSEPVLKDVNELRSRIGQIDDLYDKTVGYKSIARKEAYQKYLKELKDDYDIDDTEYGFDHYIWQEGQPAFDSAYKEYTKQTQRLKKEADDIRQKIGQTVTEGFSDQKISDWTTYAEEASRSIEDFIRFGHF